MWHGNGLYIGCVPDDLIVHLRAVVSGAVQSTIGEVFDRLSEHGAVLAGDDDVLTAFASESVASAVHSHTPLPGGERADHIDSVFTHGLIDVIAHAAAGDAGPRVSRGLAHWWKGGVDENRIELVNALRPVLGYLVRVR